MNNQVLVGYWVFKIIQVHNKSGSSPRKTLPENTHITSEVIHRHKDLEYVSTTMPIFHSHSIFQSFYHVKSFKLINFVFETGKYHS